MKEKLLSLDQIRGDIRKNLETRKEAILRISEDYQFEVKPEPRKDIPDLANEEVKFTIASSLFGFEQQQLKEIEGALIRLKTGSYGICESCEEAIGPKRLKAIPEARLCITCSRAQEAQRNSANISHYTSRRA